MSWLRDLAQLSAEDLRLLAKLAELLGSVERGPADTARAMLDAQPEPVDHDDARARLKAVLAYLDS